MRMIDADALIEDIKSFWDWDSIDGITSTTVLKQTITDISHAPTIDAVPVVRCKECQYYHQTFCEIWSKYGTIQTREQGFCYMAERRDDE